MSAKTGLVALLGVGLLLTSCSAGGNTPNSAPTNPGGAVTTNSGSPVKLRIESWHACTGLQPYITAFQKENPQIAVDCSYVTYADYVTQLSLVLNSNDGPDVFGVQEGVLTRQFAPLATDLTPYAEKSLGSDWKNQINFVDAMATKTKQVALPQDILVGGTMWYNKTLMDSLGITVPDTYDAFLGACNKLRAAGLACLAQGGKDSWQNLDLIQTIANQVKPGYIYDAIAGRKPFDSPEMIEALTTFGDLFNDGVIQKGAMAMNTYPDAADLFLKGGAGFTLLGSWANGYATKTGLADLAKQYGKPNLKNTVFLPAFFPPVVPKATTGTVFGGPDIGWAVGVKSAHKDAAWTFVQWMSTSKTAQGIVAASVQPPAAKAVQMNLADVVTSGQNHALTTLTKTEVVVGGREILDADIKQALIDALGAVASKTQTAQTAVADVQKVIKQVTGS